MSDTYNPSEADINRTNARIRRAAHIDEIVRSTSMIKSEAATLVDQGGPICSRCGERVPFAEVAAHVAAHVES